jgi:hypothetical protein
LLNAASFERIVRVQPKLKTAKQNKAAFLKLAERFRAATKAEDVKRLGEKLGRCIFRDR